jgi:hypothetical protein
VAGEPLESEGHSVDVSQRSADSKVTVTPTGALLPERCSPFLDGPDPLLRVQPEVAVGDHAGGFLECRLSMLDQVRGSSGGSAYLRTARVQGCRTGWGPYR